MQEQARKKPSEQEVIQEIVYNLIPYLPLKEMEINDGTKISDIVKAARDYNNANGHVEEDTLKTLEACLKTESGISDIGNARMYYASFNKDADDLVAHGIEAKEAASITNPDAISAAVFVYQGSEAQGIKEGVSVVFRGTPGGAWGDNANMESDCTSLFERNGFTYDWISPLDRVSLLNMQDTLQQMEEGNDESARICRQFMKEGKFVLSSHSQGGKRAVTAKGIFEELQDTRCYVFDAPGIPPEHWNELVKRWGAEKVEEMRKDTYSICADNDIVHGIGYTKGQGYFAKNLRALEVPEVDSRNPSNIMKYHYAFRLLHIDEAGKVQLQKETAQEGFYAKSVKALSDELMQMLPSDRARLMHPLMAAVQAGHAHKLPHDYNMWDYLDLAEKTSNYAPEFIALILYTTGKNLIGNQGIAIDEWIHREMNEMNPRMPKNMKQAIANSLESMQKGVITAENVWDGGVTIFRQSIEDLAEYVETKSQKVADNVKAALEETKQLAENELEVPMGKDAEGLSFIRHDQNFNRYTIDLFQFGVEGFHFSISHACDVVRDQTLAYSGQFYINPYARARAWIPHAMRFNGISSATKLGNPFGFSPYSGRFQAPPSLQLSKNLAYVCRNVDEAMGSCEENCYPLFWIPAGAHYPWKLAELLKKQHTAEIQAGVASIQRDKAALEACILESCRISSLGELEVDMPGRRPLFAFAKRVLYDARETEEILLHFAARLEKGLQAQFALLQEGRAAEGTAKRFDAATFLGKEMSYGSGADRGELGISYIDAEQSIGICEDMAVQCNHILSDVGELRYMLSRLHYVSVSHSGLDEMARIMGSWRAQQLHHREALGTYIVHCREAEVAFCERCSRIAAG